MRLVFLHGPPAAGKLAIAREIAALTGFAVFHNHLVVDAVAAVFPFGTEPFARLREHFWLEVLGEAAIAGRSLIFTFAPEPTVAPGFPERAELAVTAAGGRVDFVRLTVPAAEQERRLVDPGRAAFGKLRSPELLRRIRGDMQACEAAMPASALTIDTGAVLPGEAARLVVTTLDLPIASRAD